MSASESLDPLAAIRPAVIKPVEPADFQALGRDVPAPTLEQARATEAVFSKEENTEAAAIMSFWAAGMIAGDLARDAVGHLERDEETEENVKKRAKVKPEGA